MFCHDDEMNLAARLDHPSGDGKTQSDQRWQSDRRIARIENHSILPSYPGRILRRDLNVTKPPMGIASLAKKEQTEMGMQIDSDGG